MRTIGRLLFALLIVTALVFPTYAQQNGATRVQQDPTMLNACTPINNTAAVNNAVTVTLTPPAGQYVYVCGIDVSASQDATSTVNTNQSFTSTNLGPVGNTWAWKYSLAATVNLAISQSFYFSQPIKSNTAGTAVTIVSPTAKADTAFSINAYYYYAP